MHEGKCPECGKRLSLTPQNVNIEPARKWTVEKYTR